ncbi:MAG: hypothetical protein AAF401_17160 [Pseudomonadota bacterium]
MQRHVLWLRIVLAVLAGIILLFTLPAYANPASNPGLAKLTGEAATLGSVAGLFLGRQLALALIAVYGAVNGSTQPMLIGAAALAFFNLHDAILLSLFGAAGPGAIAGLVIGLAAIGVAATVYRRALRSWAEVKETAR